MHLILRRLPLGLIAGAMACSESTSPPAPCHGDIEVNVVTTTPVRFEWSPPCGVSALVVSTVSALPEEQTVWAFGVSEQKPVGPGILYGVKPRGATEWKAPEQLEIGRQYRVWVRFTVGGDVIVADGQSTFTWFPPD